MPDSALCRDVAGVLDHGLAGPAVLPIECRQVVVARAGRRLLDGVDVCIDGAGVTVILGPNGAGKTLLLRVLMNLVMPDSGTVRWAGAPPDRARAPRIGYVFQKPMMLRRSVLANVTYALAAIGVPRRDCAPRAREVLTLASLEHLTDTPARLLSGGEQQRLALARALATEPQVLLLDEPASSLDPAATLAIERLIGTVRGHGTRLVLVTHDIGQARRLADTVLFMHRGRIIERAPAAAFFDSPTEQSAKHFIEGRIVL
jgi:tungstate transport system ATP-binding protein